MSKTKNTELKRLSAALEAVLASPGGPTQEELAYKAGIDQGLVSRIKNGNIARDTPRTQALRRVVDAEYVKMRKVIVPVPRDVNNAVTGYLASGGDADLLVRQLELLRAAHARKPRERNSRRQKRQT
jgi:transcriptional regulator with XRE-family HTH domain